MQGGDAYVQQIPAGVKPPAVRVAPQKRVVANRPPPGAYVRIADARTQAEAIQASLSLAQRLGPSKPPFMRGDVVSTPAGPHILMFAGPFGDAAAARTFCEAALTGEACVVRIFAPTPTPNDQRPSGGPKAR